MIIQKFSTDRLKAEYNILCQRIYPLTNGHATRLPFGTTWCVVQPGNVTSQHHHHEGETFFILEGQGLMRIQDEASPVAAGDVVLIPPFSDHTLTNTSSTDNLTFLSVYWEEHDRVWEAAPPQRVLLFSAPPTPNGDMHLGHLSGPYVAVDVFRRFLRLNGVQVTYACGSDDNQSYVPTKGLALKLSPQGVIERFSTSIRATLKRYDAEPDYFLSPHGNAAYVEFVQSFFQKLLDTGKIELRKTDTPYCETCSLYLYEAHLHGTCPVCSAVTNGNGCEECGSTNDCHNLAQPVCNHCKMPAVLKRTERYYFPLSQYTDKLRSYLEGMSLPPRMRQFALALLDRGLPDVTASHLADWGIPVPNYPGQVIYAWFEMAAGYLFMAEDLHIDFWKDAKAQVFGFYGFDNSFFYLTLIPALLMAYDSAIHPISGYMINQFYTLDGLKFSTSRNHAVWGDEIVRYVPSDVIRFYLACSRSELEQTDFTVQDFATLVRRELVGEWEPWLGRLDEALAPLSHVPTVPAEPTGSCRRYAAILEGARVDITQSYTASSFSLNEAARSICELVRKSRRFLDTQWPLRSGAAAEWEGSVALAATALYRLGILVYPLMPEFGTHLLSKFEAAPLRWSAQLPGGTPLTATRLQDGRLSAALKGIEAFAATR